MSARDQGIVELVGGIVEDGRELISAHVDAIRGDIKEGLGSLAGTVRSMLIAVAVLIVTATLVCLALAATLVAAGLPTWAALWIVAAAAAAVVVGFYLNIRHHARATAAIVHRATTDDAPALSLEETT